MPLQCMIPQQTVSCMCSKSTAWHLTPVQRVKSPDNTVNQRHNARRPDTATERSLRDISVTCQCTYTCVAKVCCDACRQVLMPFSRDVVLCQMFLPCKPGWNVHGRLALTLLVAICSETPCKGVTSGLALQSAQQSSGCLGSKLKLWTSQVHLQDKAPAIHCMQCSLHAMQGIQAL